MKFNSKPLWIKLLIIVMVIILVIISIIIIFAFLFTTTDNMVVSKAIGRDTITCKIDNEVYIYEVEYDENYYPLYYGGDEYISNHLDIAHFDDAAQIIAHIKDYFIANNGSCDVVTTNLE